LQLGTFPFISPGPTVAPTLPAPSEAHFASGSRHFSMPTIKDERTMIRTSVIFAGLLLAPALATASECRDWRTIALPSDRPGVQVDLDTVAGMLPAQPENTDSDFLYEQIQALDEARYLLERAHHPLPLGDITGAWRVASIQLDTKGGFAYPHFAGHIEHTACGYNFIKTQGSQRRSGMLLPMQGNGRTLAFLGVRTYNGNTAKPYGPDNMAVWQLPEDGIPANSVGRLIRISPDTLLMILDADEQAFELYRLDR